VQVGDLVQVLPAKVGYYIITERVEPNGWYLMPVAHVNGSGPMSEEFIEVASASR